MKNATILSKNWVCTFDKPYAGKAIEEDMARLLNNLGSYLNYKDKIMGHLKGIAVSGASYIQMSMTSLHNLNVKANTGWHEKTYKNVEFTINIIILGFTKVQLQSILQDSIRGTIFEAFAI